MKKEKKENIDPILGLPKDLLEFEQITAESQEIKIYTDIRKYRKVMTIIEGISPKDIDMDALLSELKHKCACGGTIKDNKILLQGDQRNKVKKILEEKGFLVRVI